MSGRCDAILAPTNKVTGLLQEYRVSCPVYTVPTGIDLTAFRPIRPEDKPALRRTLGLPEQEKILVSVGRLAAEKNHGELPAPAGQGTCGHTASAAVCRDGPVRAQLEQQAADLGLVDRGDVCRMVPPGEVVRYYQAGDAFVCASQSETQGLTYFEALACGLPAIVRADPCLEGVVENGVNGWQWKDAAGFHQALEVLLSGTRNDSLRAGALATAERTLPAILPPRPCRCTVRPSNGGAPSTGDCPPACRRLCPGPAFSCACGWAYGPGKRAC